MEGAATACAAAAPLYPLVSFDWPAPENLKQELQRQLNNTARLCFGDLSKRRRTYVVVRQPKVRVVEDVEELRAELDAFRLPNRDVLEQREVPLLQRRSGQDVTARVAELPGLCVRVQLLERFHVEPLLNRARSSVRIANEVRPIAREARNFWRLSLEAHVC